MKEVLKPLFNRRSIREYQDRPVSQANIRDLLEAAMAAPSAAAKDPWEFLTVTDKSMLARIAEGLPNGKMLADAPLGIIAGGDLDKAHDGQLSYLLQDCSAAIENILVAASMLGLGACWLGVHPREERVVHLRNLLNIPERVIPVAALAVGWPSETKDARTRYNPDCVHTEKW